MNSVPVERAQRASLAVVLVLSQIRWPQGLLPVRLGGIDGLDPLDARASLCSEIFLIADWRQLTAFPGSPGSNWLVRDS